MRATWLARVLRDAGLDVIELAGWERRGSELERIDAVIEHATITPKTTSDEAVARLLRDGHSTLKGPLAQCGLDRKGRWWIIASGRCNHNGYGKWANQSVGVEWFLAADEHPAGEQVASAQIGTAAICRHLGLPVARVLSHAESDPKRKSDPKHVDMRDFRSAVAHFLTPAPPPEDDDMTLTCISTRAQRMPNGRFPFYRLAPDERIVLAYNGAPLRKTDGDVWTVPFMRLPPLNGKPIGICEAEDGSVLVVCEDGGTVDCA